jgi:RNA polymerase sigma-70 factor, ECF subfamily
VDELTRLACAAGAGDRYALASFVRLSQDEVHRLCGALVDRASADDLTQDTYLRAIPSLARFRGDSSARTWLLSIARRTCADAIRKRVRQRSLLERLGREETRAGDAHGLTDITDLLDRLDPDRREAFVLTQVAGLSYADAAEACDCPIGTIRSRVARARADLVAMTEDGTPAADRSA